MRAKLLTTLAVEKAVKGQQLILEGEQSKGFLVVVSGEAQITKYM